MGAPYELGSGSAELNWSIGRSIARCNEAQHRREVIANLDWRDFHDMIIGNCTRCGKSQVEIHMESDLAKRLVCEPPLTLQPE